MPVFLLILLIIICPVTAYPQDDFLVNLQGDTLGGTIRLNLQGQLQQIELTSPERKKFYFTPTQIRSFRMANHDYFPVRTPEGYRIMRLLRSGYLSLFAFPLEGQPNWDGVYLFKKDGRGTECSKLLFKKRMSRFLGDCPEVSTRIENRELDFDDLFRIVDLYNACIENRTEQMVHSGRQLNDWERLRKRVMELPAFEGQADALEIIDEILKKVTDRERIPRFLLENLRVLLRPYPEPYELLEQIAGRH